MTTMKQPRTYLRMACVREAFRQHRLARVHRSRWLFYLEHNMLEQAREARHILIHHLVAARLHWRETLGIVN